MTPRFCANASRRTPRRCRLFRTRPLLVDRRALRGCNLTGADLTNADLTGADLRGCALIDADLRGCNLTGADMRGADLTGADLKGADLSGADLRGVRGAVSGVCVESLELAHSRVRH